MKNSMKMMLAFVAGALALSACSNDDAIINENQNENENGAKLVTLTAYQEGEGGSRAAIDATDSKKIDWTANDKINYFGGATGESMTLKTGAGTTSATFEGTVTTGSTDYVLYPYQSTATNNAGVITAEVPMTQYAVANSFDPKAALMVGQVNAGSVQLKNVMSYVKVTIPSTMTNCKQVSLKAKDAWTTVAGKVNITASTGAWAETTAKEGQAFVRLVPQDGETKLTAGASYYIAILPQTMATGFELIFNDNDIIKVKQAASSVEFGRSKTKKLAAISDFTYTVGTVTAGSITMADRNIGVGGTGTTVPTGTDAYGDYFAWGALRPAYTKKPSSGTTLTDLYWSDGFTPSHVPSTFTDIAAMLWGGNWRMATYDEWNNNTSNSSVLGLPLAGVYYGTYLFNDGYNCYYWSSTPSDGSAYYLNTDGYYAEVSDRERSNGFSVRPVLANPAPAAGANLLSGEFTVAAGKTVKFTKSNLYWDGSAFKFEANQTDYPTSWDANHVSHFYWSKTASVAYAQVYNDASASTSDKFFCGVDNKITVEGTEGLYALSSDEWTYLLSTRTVNGGTGEGYSWKKDVSVAGKDKCLIIAPDGYTGTLESEYDATTWAAAETAGLVCLPAAGARFGSNFSGGSGMGGCWSSSPDASNASNAYFLLFNSRLVQPYNDARSAGYSLRLVK